MHFKNVILTLGILGLLPFLFLIYGAIDKQIIFGLSPLAVFITYSSIILTFLAGSLWGDKIVTRESIHLTPSQAVKNSSVIESNENIGIALAVISNVIAITCWILIILPQQLYMISLSVQLVGFVIILWVEASCSITKKKILQDSYLALRCLLTFVVCTAHLAMIMLS
jgi:hypothetical protein